METDNCQFSILGRIQFVFILFGGHTWQCSGLVLVLYTDIASDKICGTIIVLGIEPEYDMYKASALSTVLSLWPQDPSFSKLPGRSHSGHRQSK